MHRYSHLFSTLHDERAPVGFLGAYYSILRAVVWDDKPTPHYHDFAVIWDEDHDERVIWTIEQLYLRRMLPAVLAIGERKGNITALTAERPPRTFVKDLENIAQDNPRDPFVAYVERFDEATGYIVPTSPEKVRAYLKGIDALWGLGSREPLRLGPDQSTSE